MATLREEERAIDLDAAAALRFARYLTSFRNELMAITHACGYQHPSEFTAEDVEISTGPAQFKTLREMEGYTPKRAKARV